MLEMSNLTAVSVVGGNGVYGTRKLLHDGSGTLGTANAYSYLKNIYVTGVTSAAISSVLTLYSATPGTGVACTRQYRATPIDKTAHGLVDGEQVFFASLTDATKGVPTKIIYYVVNKTDNTFEVA